ncbi:MAG: dUTP diphosphatase [Williamsia sp.]|nr:dUTP diphosphatase [Williamsia sp.]
MPAVTVHVINKSANALPRYATEGAAGMDIMADLSEPLTLSPLQRFAVPTGLYIELPPGYEAQVRPRSGLALKHGITCLNSPGTIDADYRGEIKVILVNLSHDPYTISTGDRIAQLIVQKVETVAWRTVESITATQRNEGGYGHTGK